MGRPRSRHWQLDAEQVGGIGRRLAPLVKIQAVELQVLTRRDQVFDADLGAFEAEVISADFDHRSSSDPAAKA